MPAIFNSFTKAFVAFLVNFIFHGAHILENLAGLHLIVWSHQRTNAQSLRRKKFVMESLKNEIIIICNVTQLSSQRAGDFLR